MAYSAACLIASYAEYLAELQKCRQVDFNCQIEE